MLSHLRSWKGTAFVALVITVVGGVTAAIIQNRENLPAWALMALPTAAAFAFTWIGLYVRWRDRQEDARRKKEATTGFFSWLGAKTQCIAVIAMTIVFWVQVETALAVSAEVREIESAREEAREERALIQNEARRLALALADMHLELEEARSEAAHEREDATEWRRRLEAASQREKELLVQIKESEELGRLYLKAVHDFEVIRKFCNDMSELSRPDELVESYATMAVADAEDQDEEAARIAENQVPGLRKRLDMIEAELLPAFALFLEDDLVGQESYERLTQAVTVAKGEADRESFDRDSYFSLVTSVQNISALVNACASDLFHSYRSKVDIAYENLKSGPAEAAFESGGRVSESGE